MLAAACSSGSKPDTTDAGPDGPPWALGATEPPPRPGMAWIPAGSLVAGTAPGKVPRVPDEEMAGEQLTMSGYYIDLYPFPNEQGALPRVGVTQAEAKEACEAAGKRLCTELELERACKGPDNTTYEYGDTYKASACNTGVARAPGPNGMTPTCASGFGVHDLHGGAWSWTASDWKRDPTKSGLVALRGGNGAPGELIGRCANGRGLRPDTRSNDIGFRCCAGEANTAEVTVSIPRGPPLTLRKPDRTIAPALEGLARADPAAPDAGRFTVERMWIWRPFGNEELWWAAAAPRRSRASAARSGAAAAGSSSRATAATPR
ncbi:MAG: SUMF1/EgtB/PvdO family nonheme iron enzyme [Polyangiaceae bacterium]